MKKQKDIINQPFHTKHKRIIRFFSILVAIAIAVIFLLNLVSLKSSKDIIRDEVARILNKESNKLTDEDFAQITRLDIPARNLTSLRYLRKFTNLEELILSNTTSHRFTQQKPNTLQVVLNKIQETIFKNHNSRRPQINGDGKISIKSIKPLSNLKNLKKLKLNGAQVSNLKPIAKLVNLQELDLSGTQIRELGPIKKLKNLKKLYLSRTQVNKLDPIKELTNLQELWIGPNVQNLEPLRKLRNLETLNINGSKIYNINPIRELTNLRKLYISDTETFTLEPIRNLTKLQILELNDTKVSTLEPIQKLTNLKELSFLRTSITNIEPLCKLKNLKGLSFGSTKPALFNLLKNSKSKDYFDWGPKDINTLEPIRGLSNLERLIIIGTDISSFEPINELSNLKTISLFNCRNLIDRDIADLKKLFPNTEIYIPFREGLFSQKIKPSGPHILTKKEYLVFC